MPIFIKTSPFFILLTELVMPGTRIIWTLIFCFQLADSQMIDWLINRLRGKWLKKNSLWDLQTINTWYIAGNRKRNQLSWYLHLPFQRRISRRLWRRYRPWYCGCRPHTQINKNLETRQGGARDCWPHGLPQQYVNVYWFTFRLNCPNLHSTFTNKCFAFVEKRKVSNRFLTLYMITSDSDLILNF